jgi:hypothetical protein
MIIHYELDKFGAQQRALQEVRRGTHTEEVVRKL